MLVNTDGWDGVSCFSPLRDTSFTPPNPYGELNSPTFAFACQYRIGSYKGSKLRVPNFLELHPLLVLAVKGGVRTCQVRVAALVR